MHGFTVQHLSDMINNLFSIPVWKKHLDVSCDIQNDLLNQIEQNYEQNKHYIQPKWNCVVHSTMENHNDIDYDQIIPFYKKEYENFVSEQNLNLFNHNYWIQNPWYNYYVKHSNQDIHSHLLVNVENNKFNFFSGVYFLKLKEDHPKIIFYNSNNNLTVNEHLPKVNSYFNNQEINHSFTIKKFTFDVKEGDLIIFPSNLEHYVPQQRVDVPRITIAFNIQSEWRQIK